MDVQQPSTDWTGTGPAPRPPTDPAVPGRYRGWPVSLARLALGVAAGCLGAHVLAPKASDSASGSLYLGLSDCTGAEVDPGAVEKCAVEIALGVADLPELSREATAGLRSIELAHVALAELFPCSQSPTRSVEGTPSDERKGGVVRSGAERAIAESCVVARGPDSGLSLRASGDTELGVVRLDPLRANGTHAALIRLLAMGRNKVALVEEAAWARTTEVMVRPEREAALEVLNQAAHALAPDVASRLLAQSPTGAGTRVNLGWRTTPGVLWRDLHVASISGAIAPNAAKSEVDWLGEHHEFSSGRIRVAAQDLEASIALGCDGRCFKVSFSGSKVQVSRNGSAISGPSEAWQKRWFEAFAATCALALGLLGELFSLLRTPK